MAPPKKWPKRPIKDKNQASIFQMSGFQRANQDAETDHDHVSDTSIVAIDLNDEVNAHSQELNDEHQRILLARKTWKESWLQDYDWLRFNFDKGKAFCKYCMEDKKCRSIFGREGATNLKTSAFREHSESDQHKHAIYLMKKGGKDSLLRVDKRKRESTDAALLHLFRTAYLVGKEDLAYTKFVPQLHLLRACGVAVPLLYNDDKACSDFLKCISKSLEASLLEKIRLSPWFGIMVDESTDVSVTQKLVLYISYLDDFQPKRSFLGMLQLPAADAKTITNTIMEHLTKSELDMQKLVGFGSDGASVMVGCKTGVATRLKEQVPFMTSIHCVAHRTNLCVQSVSKHPKCKAICERVDSLINGAATYFTHSPQRGQFLAEIQEELAYSTLRLEHISSTRWLSRHHAVQKLCESFEPLMEVFKVNSVRTYEELRQFKIVYILHFLADILKHLTTLSLDFQHDWIDVTSIEGLVSTTKRQIQSDFMNQLSALDIKAFSKDSKGYPVIPDYGNPGGYLVALRGAVKGNMYRSVEMVRDINGDDLVEAMAFQMEFSTAVLEALDDRFRDHEILACFKILTPAYMPKSVKEINEFGHKEVNTLMKFYGESKNVGGAKFNAVVSEDKFRLEFRKFKIQASTEWKNKNFTDTWSIILSEKILREDKYAEMSSLAMVAMVQCSSTVICERGFSQMNHIKDKYRNQLNTAGVDALMRVSIEGPAMEKLEAFDFHDSISIWKSSKEFRHIFAGSSSTMQHANDKEESDEELMLA